MRVDPDELLSVKELAAALKRSAKYVYRMRVLGFRTTGGRATLREARVWLRRNQIPFRKA